jgi:hypothetical protein
LMPLRSFVAGFLTRSRRLDSSGLGVIAGTWPTLAKRPPVRRIQVRCVA